VLQRALVFLADWLPPIAFVAALAVLLFKFFNVSGSGEMPHLVDFLLPFIVLLAVLIILHILISILLPLRWRSIRGEFQSRLEDRLHGEMRSVYGPLPGDVAEALNQERKKVERLQGETGDVADWLAKRERAASITSLYGN